MMSEIRNFGKLYYTQRIGLLSPPPANEEEEWKSNDVNHLIR